MHLRDTNHLVLDGETSPQVIRDQLEEAAGRLDVVPQQESTEGDVGRHPSLDVSLSTVMSVVDSFFVIRRDETMDLLEQAATALGCAECDREQLLGDLKRRESYGTVLFEDLGIRLLHCRSDGVPDPRAGVIQSDPGDEPTTLVLAAPTDAQQTDTHVLSEIVIALAEESDLVSLLSVGKEPDIRSRLLALFEKRPG